MHMESTTLDIEFRHLTYSVQSTHDPLSCCSGNHSTPRTEILHNVSGQFNAGELTAILGPSGAGKTSLLKILAGFRTSGVKGEILLNNQRRGVQHRRLSCLIPQNTSLLENLTLRETLQVAAKLKLGCASKEKLYRCNTILETCRILGLDGCLDTPVGCLSGGERKRLSCAVELLSNPPLMFFDEPTSGLDSCSSQQVLSHLRILAQEGRRNIICSIHQPSSKLFQSFDSIYVLSEGRCVIKGPRELLVQNLANMNFQCPQFYNPADFVLEVASGERGDISSLVKIAAEMPDKENNQEKTPEETSYMLPALEVERKEKFGRCNPFNFGSKGPQAPGPVCNIAQQFWILFQRALLVTFKDLHMAWLRSAAHLMVGVMLGCIFFNMGNDAAKVTGNVGFIFFVMMFLFFSNAMPTVLTFPTEMSVMLREHLNGWYSVKAYYMARSIADIPLQIMCPTSFLFISYYMSDQPWELDRFFKLWLIGILLTFLAQSLGLLIGAASDITMGMFLLPVISIPMLLFSGYFVPVADIPLALRWLSNLSAFYYAFEACMIALYGAGRPRLRCSQEYCHYVSPTKLMSDMNVQEDRFLFCILALVGFILVLRVLLYFTLKIRVKMSK